ncbi:MAG: isopenicillin N synthase family oxygenase [Verrucomicrobia bacterium]|nr:isopenicillin N synthase family oxygenase [Leptolyngbya sp. ES-bin-22]
MTAIVLDSITIPVIDFEPFISGDAEAQQQVAQEIYQACHTAGFMYLKNHGIAADVLEQVFQQSQRFFALPLETKQQLAWTEAFSNRGYIGVQRERLNPQRPGDAKECFNIGKEEPRKEERSLSGSDLSQAALTQNRWLPEDDEFRQTMLGFFGACIAATDRILQAFALSLQLPPSFLIDLHSKRENTLRLLHYPSLETALEPDQIRAGEHSDYGSVTLLFQDDVGGLEVQSRSGEWLFAPCIPDTLLVNTGDLMERWTNDVFRSTKHRVGVPTGDRAHRSRYAIAFFCYPNMDVEISCIDSCQSPTSPSKYAPVLAGDYLIDLLQATY